MRTKVALERVGQNAISFLPLLLGSIGKQTSLSHQIKLKLDLSLLRPFFCEAPCGRLPASPHSDWISAFGLIEGCCSVGGEGGRSPFYKKEAGLLSYDPFSPRPFIKSLEMALGDFPAEGGGFKPALGTWSDKSMHISGARGKEWNRKRIHLRFIRRICPFCFGGGKKEKKSPIARRKSEADKSQSN